VRRAVLAAVVLASACGGGARDESGRPSVAAVAVAREHADEAATSLTADLFTELARVVTRDSSAEAVDACGDVARRLTERATARWGIRVHRTSLRLRSPMNAPDAYERRVLEEWARPGGKAEPHAEVVPTGDGGYELRYLRPIILQPVCMTCHGRREDIPPVLRAAIEARYPDDQATGFRIGDVRGAVSARVPLL
jgi:hypothetical protein